LPSRRITLTPGKYHCYYITDLANRIVMIPRGYGCCKIVIASEAKQSPTMPSNRFLGNI
jgi:hypothetical protein